MKVGRDLIKTVGALLIIGIIVVATFMYGNRQRQEQIRRDQQIREEQQVAQTDNQSEQEQQPAQQETNQEEPPQQPAVQKPQQPALQNPQPAPAEQQQPVPQPSAQQPVATAPNGEPQPARTPETGDELIYLLPVAVVALMWQANRSSRESIRDAYLRNS